MNAVDPVEVIVRASSGIRSRTGLKVRYNAVGEDDRATRHGLRVTSLNRTLRDLCARFQPAEALVYVDMAVANKQIDLRNLADYAASARPLAGAWRLSQLAEIAAPAESPMETKLRWILVNAGLPRPQVQSDLRDGDGRFVGRADLYYPGPRLVIEYDGVNHRERLAADNRRQNLLVNAGFKLLRFTASDLERPDLVVSQVRRALAGL